MTDKTTARVIAYPQKHKSQDERHSGHSEQEGPAVEAPNTGAGEADFLSTLAARDPEGNRLQMELRRFLGEIQALRGENRWDDLVALFHPVEEKVPDLVAAGMDIPIRASVAFALGQLEHFQEAIEVYQRCVEAEPDNFHNHSGLAYTAYNSLYAAKNRRLTLHPAERKARIQIAHKHFAAAQSLRPEGVTNFYRQGMLYKQIQNQTERAVPLFQTTVGNWEARAVEEKKQRHQERKNYVKALYNLASCLLDENRAGEAVDALLCCLEKDRASNHLSALHKYFALGKIHFHLGEDGKALNALETALVESRPEEHDYVYKLLARVHLVRRELEKAWNILSRVPLKKRRPYVRWKPTFWRLKTRSARRAIPVRTIAETGRACP